MAVHLRQPSITITYGPDAAHQTTITRVLKAHTTLGLDISVGEATFSVPAQADLHGATYWSIVSITLTAGGGGRLWMGYITEFDYTLYPREIGVICKGFLIRAQLMRGRARSTIFRPLTRSVSINSPASGRAIAPMTRRQAP
jgi:hypothetical protein